MAFPKRESHRRRIVISLVLIHLLTIGIFLHWTWSTFWEGPRLLEKHLCSVTSRIEEIREFKGDLHKNPVKKVIDDLIQIVEPPRKQISAHNNNYSLYSSPASRWPILTGVCDKKKNETKVLLVLVTTARSSFKTRILVRKTWGSLLKYEDWEVRVIFFVGQSKFCLLPMQNRTSENKTEAVTEDIALKEEAEKYGDIVFGVFTDTYRNLTYKTLTSFKFVLDFCPEADLVLKADDDNVADIPKILDKRNADLKLKAESEARNLSFNLFDIYCSFNPLTFSERFGTKFTVTFDEWPFDQFPPYCGGGSQVITVDWIRKIYSVRLLEPLLWIEDVFITGILRRTAEKLLGNSAARIFHINTPYGTHDPTRIKRRDYLTEVCDVQESSGAKTRWFMFLKPDDPEAIECVWKWILRRLKTNSANFTLREID